MPISAPISDRPARAATAQKARQRAAAVLLLLLLGGCGEGEIPLAGPPLPGTIEASFVPGGPADVITVTVVDPLALARAVAHGPHGESVAAYSIDVTRSPSKTTGVAGDMFPLNMGVPLLTTETDANFSTALIRLPDPIYYAHTWRDWRIELQLGLGGDGGRTVTLPGPRPPGGSVGAG